STSVVDARLVRIRVFDDVVRPNRLHVASCHGRRDLDPLLRVGTLEPLDSDCKCRRRDELEDHYGQDVLEQIDARIYTDCAGRTTTCAHRCRPAHHRLLPCGSECEIEGLAFDGWGAGDPTPHPYRARALSTAA